jgi:hypothetical protein
MHFRLLVKFYWNYFEFNILLIVIVINREIGIDLKYNIIK